jgi:hypothetical protein
MPAKSISGFERDVTQRLARIEILMISLAGNGQPGRVGLLEVKMNRQDKLLYIGLGVALALGWLIGALLGHYGFHIA